MYNVCCSGFLTLADGRVSVNVQTDVFFLPQNMFKIVSVIAFIAMNIRFIYVQNFRLGCEYIMSSFWPLTETLDDGSEHIGCQWLVMPWEVISCFYIEC